MLSIAENSYGFRKRLVFVKELIETRDPKRILDVGCGTGENLTIPLAEQFPKIHFLALDMDVTSIEFAKKTNKLPNLIFGYPGERDANEDFDLIIASEVIEHVDEPGNFLLSLRNNLADRGTIILTTPNGYGPFEIVTLIEGLFYVTGIMKFLSKIKRFLLGKPKSTTIDLSGTLAISPHVNFFTLKELSKLVTQSGLKIIQIRSRTFLCGYLIDNMLKGQAVLRWNANIADSLPHILTSGWMFVLEKEDSVDPEPFTYKRRFNARIRKYLNAKRWGIKT